MRCDCDTLFKKLLLSVIYEFPLKKIKSEASWVFPLNTEKREERKIEREKEGGEEWLRGRHALIQFVIHFKLNILSICSYSLFALLFLN